MSGAAEPVFVGDPSDVELTDQLLTPIWGPKHKSWRAAFAVTGAGTLALVGLILYTFYEGIGTWGVNIPVAWAFAISSRRSGAPRSTASPSR